MIRWAALWHEKNRLDGVTKHLLCEKCVPVLFRTRQECREWIESKYGYIREDSGLRGEPHGWRMPKAVKVSIEIAEAKR